MCCKTKIIFSCIISSYDNKIMAVKKNRLYIKLHLCEINIVHEYKS